MVSRTAIESLEDLEAQGLRPTWTDAIRLNALGLRLEGSRGRDTSQSAYHLPRLALVSRDVSFRQPTVGHEMWLARAERWISPTDAESRLALYCYALSRPWQKLVPPETPSAVESAVSAYAATLKEFTREQLRAAVDYAIVGADPTAGEVAAKRPSVIDENGEECDLDECVAVGVLDSGRAVLFGATAADMKSMTLAQLARTIREAYLYHQMSLDGESSRLEADYYATVDEIAARLRAESAHPRENPAHPRDPSNPPPAISPATTASPK